MFRRASGLSSEPTSLCFAEEQEWRRPDYLLDSFHKGIGLRPQMAVLRSACSMNGYRRFKDGDNRKLVFRASKEL